MGNFLIKYNWGSLYYRLLLMSVIIINVVLSLVSEEYLLMVEDVKINKYYIYRWDSYL